MQFGGFDYWLSPEADDRLIATAVELMDQMAPD